MANSNPLTAPQQPARWAWSPEAIGGVTLLVMIMLVPLGLIFGILSLSSTLALGIFAGFVMAGINWLRLGQRRKGLLHLLISPLIYLFIPLGLPLLLATLVKVLGAGSAEHLTEIKRGFTAEFLFILYGGTAALLVGYLYWAMHRDIGRLQVQGTTIKFDEIRLLLGGAAASVVLMWGATTFAIQAYVNSQASRFYCDFLQAEYPQPEILPERVQIYAGSEPEIYFPSSEMLAYHQHFYQDSSSGSRDYGLWLWVGYDAEGYLAWRMKGIAPDTNPQCPWTLTQRVTAR